jgi:hypothetical protein
MQRVYLDQWVWVALARAFHDDDPSADEVDALTLAQSAVKLGLASFPLSFLHYAETYTARAPERRRRLADVMADVSKFHTIAPESALRIPEVDEALYRRFGRPLNRREHDVFGVGVAHAFDEPDGVPPEQFRRHARAQELIQGWEYFSLAGPQPEIAGSEGAEMESWKTPALDFARAQEEFAEELGALAHRRSERVADAVAAQELWDLASTGLLDAMTRAGLPADALFEGGKDGLMEFIEDVPTRNVAFHLRRFRHSNPQKKWSRTDLADIGALGVAVPYCDAVVTEAVWVDGLKRARLDERYGTKLMRSVSELRAYLAGLA